MQTVGSGKGFSHERADKTHSKEACACSGQPHFIHRSKKSNTTLQLAFPSLSLVKEEDAPRAAKRRPQKRRFSLTFSRKNRESDNENVVGYEDARCDPHSRFSDSRVSYDRGGRVAPSRTLRSASAEKANIFVSHQRSTDVETPCSNNKLFSRRFLHRRHLVPTAAAATSSSSSSPPSRRLSDCVVIADSRISDSW